MTAIVITKHKISGTISVSPNPRYHPTLEAAIAEAKRLATRDTSKIFIAVPLDEAYSYSDIVKVSL